MDLQYIFVLLATIFVGTSSVSQLDGMAQHFQNSNQNAKKTATYCGHQLSQTLSAVCRGNYNTLNKKSEIYNADNWISQYTSDSQKGANTPFRNKASATTLNYQRRRKRGVFNECCEKPCSQEELSTYCGTSRK